MLAWCALDHGRFVVSCVLGLLCERDGSIGLIVTRMRPNRIIRCRSGRRLREGRRLSTLGDDGNPLSRRLLFFADPACVCLYGFSH